MSSVCSQIWGFGGAGRGYGLEATMNSKGDAFPTPSPKDNYPNDSVKLRKVSTNPTDSQILQIIIKFK